MAASNAHETPPPLNPRKIKRLIERLSFDNQFRTHFEEVVQQNRSYDRIRNIDPEFPGPFTPYYLSLQYLLHDPRLEKLYEQHYKSLSNPQILEYVCAELAKQEHMMGELDKGILFEREDQEALQSIITPSPESQNEEQKIEEVLKKTVKKKEEEKEQKVTSSTSGGGTNAKIKPTIPISAQGAARPSSTAVPSPFSAPHQENVTVAKSAVAPIENKSHNPLSFRIKQINYTIAPILRNVGKKIGSAGAIFYKKHPITSMAALGSAVGGIVSTIAGWPGSPVSGMAIGALAPAFIRQAMRIVSPPPQAESEENDNFEIDGSREGGADGGGAEENSHFSLPSQGMSRPGGFSVPGRPLLNRVRNLRRGAQLLRGARTAATLARVAPLMANPIFWIVVGVLILLLIIFLLIILPTTSLLPPFGDNAGTATGASNLRITKSGPLSAEKYNSGDRISFTISVTYTGSGVGSAEVVDTLPEKTNYVTANPPGTVEGNKVKWSLTNLSPNTTQTISLEVQTTAEITDSWVVNTVTGSARGGSSSAPGGSCPSAEAIAANKKSPEECQYLKPAFDIHDTNISAEQINTYVSKYAPRFVQAGVGNEAEFRRRVDYMIQKSQQVGLNPIIVLGFWKTESGFSTAGNRAQHGCLAKWVNSFESSVNCAVGLLADGVTPGGSFSARCAASKISQPEKDSACKMLADIRKAHPDKYANIPVSFPITTIDDYMETYGSRAPNLGDAPINRNCMHSYNLMLETISELNACRPSNDGPTTGGPNQPTAVTGTPTQCGGEVISLGYTKKLLPLPAENNCSQTATKTCGRPGTCIKPAKIVIHTTISEESAQKTYEYFYGGAGNRGVGTHFVIGKDGTVIQMVELLKDQVETSRGVANYSDHISIELVHGGIYNSKNEVPAAQYTSLVKMVKQLMSQYNLPIGELQYDWKAPSDERTDLATPGLYGHYQLNPKNKQDPGVGLMRDLRKDL